MKLNSRRKFLKKSIVAGVAACCVPPVQEVFSAGAVKSLGLRLKDDSVILFQGDSITDGNRGRNKDPNHIMGHGYAFSIASRLGADFPEKRYAFYNRGISGNKIVDLEARWQKDVLDLTPNVLSILVGVNDASSMITDWKPEVSVEKYEAVYDRLLATTVDNFPAIVLVLCEPFLLKVGNIKEHWEAYHADIQKRQAVVQHLAGKYKAVFVPFQKVFSQACEKAPADYWIWDGVHPTVAGHELMTRAWLKQVGERILF